MCSGARQHLHGCMNVCMYMYPNVHIYIYIYIYARAQVLGSIFIADTEVRECVDVGGQPNTFEIKDSKVCVHDA
jgi:hypothetical protein